MTAARRVESKQGGTEMGGRNGWIGRAAVVAGGAALGAVGFRRSSPGGLAAAALGGALVYAGMRPRPAVVSVRTAVTVRRSPADVYHLWRRLEELPRYMTHLAAVTEIDGSQSVWSLDVPGLDRHVEWTARITADEFGRRIAWESLPGGDVTARGEVRFEEDHEGTVVRVDVSYRIAGGLAAKVLNPVLARMIRHDVRRMKSFLEAGEIPTVDGQPTARS